MMGNCRAARSVYGSMLYEVAAAGREEEVEEEEEEEEEEWGCFLSADYPAFTGLRLRHVSDLLTSEASGQGPSSLGSPVHAAAVNGDRGALLKLITAEPSLRDCEDQFGRTPLMYCVLADRLDCAEALLKAGASVNKTDHSQRSALHLTAHKCVQGNVRFLKLLLSRRADWLQKDLEGMTPLHLATRHPSPKPLALLLKHIGPGEVDTQDKNKTARGKIPPATGARDSQEPSATQTVRCILETVGVFLSHPTVKDEPDLEGRTAFMWAAGKGSDDVIRTMLATSNMDINMADKYGGTALHAASLSGHMSTVRLLLEKGAMVDSLDVMKHTPLFRACEMGQRDVILTLIKDVDGHTALHWAALGGNAEVCQVLMENRISPNVQDQAGRTPLQCAAYGGYITCMAALMENNADPNIQDKEREEEQRRREAEQQISLASTEQRKTPPERVEHRRHSLANKMKGLALRDPALEPRKPSKSERLKAKEELRKQKGSDAWRWFTGK
ncbi:hypothetical protein CRUP_034948 [Coryphaenoides rupestris]|nr:hypothetical protein CRUP_034948 [Coryphaenoides rupestris]